MDNEECRWRWYWQFVVAGLMAGVWLLRLLDLLICRYGGG